MLTISTFKALLPEFTDYDDALIQSAITITYALNCGYVGLEGAIRETALGLSVASYLVSNRGNSEGLTQESIPGVAGNQNIKRYKSYDDEIEFYQDTSSNLEEASNSYQRTLNSLIDSSYLGGIAIPGSIRNSICGC